MLEEVIVVRDEEISGALRYSESYNPLCRAYTRATGRGARIVLGVLGDSERPWRVYEIDASARWWLTRFAATGEGEEFSCTLSPLFDLGTLECYEQAGMR